MRLAYRQTLTRHPYLVETSSDAVALVQRKRTHQADTKAVFFCYRLPAKNGGEWDEQVSITRWYLYDLESKEITESAPQIFESINVILKHRGTNAISRTDLKEIRRQLDEHVLNSYLRKVQAPRESKPL